MELARSWFRGGSVSCPRELQELLASHSLTNGCLSLLESPFLLR